MINIGRGPMRKMIRAIDEAAIFFTILAGIYFWIGFIIIAIFTYLKNIMDSPI